MSLFKKYFCWIPMSFLRDFRLNNSCRIELGYFILFQLVKSNKKKQYFARGQAWSSAASKAIWDPGNCHSNRMIFCLSLSSGKIVYVQYVHDLFSRFFQDIFEIMFKFLFIFSYLETSTTVSFWFPVLLPFLFMVWLVKSMKCKNPAFSLIVHENNNNWK